MDKRIDQDYSDFEAGIIEELEVRLAEQKDLMDRAMIAWEESGRPFLMPEEVQSWWMMRPLFSPTLEKASNKNVGGFMEVKVGQVWRNIHTERDLKVIFVGRYDATLADEEGTLSDALWKFEKGIYAIVSDSPLSDLEIVRKALDKSFSRLSIGCGGGWLAEKNIDTVTGKGYDIESLLAWAKQTIGEE